MPAIGRGSDLRSSSARSPAERSLRSFEEIVKWLRSETRVGTTSFEESVYMYCCQRSELRSRLPVGDPYQPPLKIRLAK